MAGPLRPFPLRRRAVASDDVARPKTVANLRQVVPTSCCTPADFLSRARHRLPQSRTRDGTMQTTHSGSEHMNKPELLIAGKSPFAERYDNFIGGKWLAPRAGQYFDNVSPVTGQVVCKIARSDAQDIEAALDAAHAAKDAWGRTSVVEHRLDILRIRARDLADDLAGDRRGRLQDRALGCAGYRGGARRGSRRLDILRI